MRRKPRDQSLPVLGTSKEASFSRSLPTRRWVYKESSIESIKLDLNVIQQKSLEEGNLLLL